MLEYINLSLLLILKMSFNCGSPLSMHQGTPNPMDSFEDTAEDQKQSDR